MPGPTGVRQAFSESAAQASVRDATAEQAESGPMPSSTVSSRSPARRTPAAKATAPATRKASATATPASGAKTERKPARTPAAKAPSAGKRAPGTKPVRHASADQGVERVDTRYLESLIGYNARRAALAVIGVFLERMAPYGLRPVDFSALSLITHNPGITARQLCNTLGILPPNMVGMINGFERRGLIERRPHPTDRRAQGLHLTAAGRPLMRSAEKTAADLEQDVAHKLTATQQKTLMRLLQKVYL